MPLAISYARVSSGRQRREGAGIERQIEQAAQYAEQHGLTLDRDFSLADEGRSASKGHHLRNGAALHRIREAVVTGQLGPSPTLLIEDASRLSRLEPLDGLEQVFLPLLRNGARIVLLEDGSVYDEDAINRDQSALLTLVIKIQTAATYAKKLKEYGLAHRAKNRQQILNGEPVCKGWAPSWIEYGDSGWQFNPYAATVRRLLELMLIGGSQATASALNREGHKAPQGKPWSQTSVLRLLENPALYGARRIADPDYASTQAQWRKAVAKWETGGQVGPRPLKPKRTYSEVPDTYPALLTRAEYDRLLAVIAKRLSSPKEKGQRNQFRYVGQLLTHCICGAPIGVRHVKDRRNPALKWSYLFCRGKERGITTCTRSPIRLEPVQAHLLTRLRADQLKTLLVSDSTARETKAAALVAREGLLRATLAQQEQQVANARAALKERAKSGRSVDVYEEALDEATAALAATKADLGVVMVEVTELDRSDVPNALDDAVRALLLEFANGESTKETRQRVNQLLHRLEMVITLDTKEQRLGLAVGEQEIDWQPLNAALDLAALKTGVTEAIYLEFEVELDLTPEQVKQLQAGIDVSEAARRVLGLETAEPMVMAPATGE